MRFTQWVRLLKRYGPPKVQAKAGFAPSVLIRPLPQTVEDANKKNEKKPVQNKGKKKGQQTAAAEEQPSEKSSSTSSNAALLSKEDIPTWLLTHVSPGYC